MIVTSHRIEIDDTFVSNALALKGVADFVYKSNKGGWQSELCSYSTYDWAQPVLDQVLAIVEKPTTELTYWFNINGKDHYNEWHDHCRGTDGELCGCLYAVAPDNCGSIEFQDRNKTFSITPHKGLLVLFPDHAMHRVLPNNSDENRLSIAFNFWKMLHKHSG